jgi:hypothetical protein
MKRLFIVDNNNEIDLNKEWLHLIPEFAKILHRKWLCEGDADGRKKVMARRIFAYIYLTVDYASPLFTWTKEARHEEAMKAQQLKEGDLQSDGVKAAIERYEEMQLESVPALKALRAMYSSLEKMNTYLEAIDMSERDKQGKAVQTPASITRAIKDMNAAYDAVSTMERRIMEDLKKEANTIRGTATLGGKEGKRGKDWREGSGPAPTELQKSIETALENGKEIVAIETSPDFRQMGDYLMKMTKDDEDSDGGEF